MCASITLRHIDLEFSSEGFEPDDGAITHETGQRRNRFKQYLARIDLPSAENEQRLLRVIAGLIQHVDAIDRSSWSGPTGRTSADPVRRQLEIDGYLYKNGTIEAVNASVALKRLSATAVKFDASHLKAQIDRLYRAVETDPDLSIGQAKELVETCCRTILTDHGIKEDKPLELAPLVRRTMECLKLVPEGISDEARGAKTIKAVLGNLSQISQGLAELRNLYGTGHGKDGRRRGLPLRHARLAVAASVALVTFLFDTHSDKPPTPPRP